MIASALTYAILTLSGLIGSGIAVDEIRKATHKTTNPTAKPVETSQAAE